MRGRASYPRVTEGQNWLSTTLGFQNTWFPWPPVITQAMDINIDPTCSGTMDPDMVLGSSSRLDATTAPVADQVIQTTMALVAVWLSDTNMASGGSPNPRQPCGIWWQHGSWM